MLKEGFKNEIENGWDVNVDDLDNQVLSLSKELLRMKVKHDSEI
jgi:hypothetical protein